MLGLGLKRSDFCEMCPDTFIYLQSSYEAQNQYIVQLKGIHKNTSIQVEHV